MELIDAIERLTDFDAIWEYDAKAVVMVLDALDEYQMRAEAAEAIVAKLPKTADCVPVTPGDSVFVADSLNGRKTVAQTIVWAIKFSSEPIQTSWGRFLASECYSTREMALAAQEEKP